MHVTSKCLFAGLSVTLCLLLSACGNEKRTDDRDNPISTVDKNSKADSGSSENLGTLQRLAVESSRPEAVVDRNITVDDEPQTGSHGNEATLTGGGVKRQPVFRPDDNRPQHDDRRLAQLGIFAYESKRLKLYSDIPPEKAQQIPPVINAAYDALESYFGKMPPNRAGADYQVTGYVMADKMRFDQAGLIPRDLPWFLNGRHRGLEFWMYDQQQDYYCRHLAIHEFTHCFMTTLPDVQCPLWYLEGMAELFGTHRISAGGNSSFRVMPDNKEDFSGLGRITIIQQDVDQGKAMNLAQVTQIPPKEFMKNRGYAWAWAICKFLDAHPSYRDKFRNLGQHTQGSAFRKTFQQDFVPLRDQLAAEWPVFANQLEDGFDITAAAIAFHPGRPLPTAGISSAVFIEANHGWQSSKVHLQAGETYEIVAEGQFTLANVPRPWVSEAEGITFRYNRGKPLGKLMGAVFDSSPTNPDHNPSLLSVIPLGNQSRFRASYSGTLFLRLNDAWSELSDNTGRVSVTVRHVTPQ